LSALLPTLTGLLRLLAGILLAAVLAALLTWLLLPTLVLLATLVVLSQLRYSLNPLDQVQRTPHCVVPPSHLTDSKTITAPPVSGTLPYRRLS
jgi:hypothetical protein